MSTEVEIVKTKKILVNKKEYTVNHDEYNTVSNAQYCNLKILDQLGFHERQISLLSELSTLFEEKVSLKANDVTHGGFIPLQCASYFQTISINNNPEHYDNIIHNTATYSATNIVYHSDVHDKNDLFEVNFNNQENNIIISLLSETRPSYYTYTLTNLTTEWTPQPTLYLHVSEQMNEKFVTHFKHYLNDSVLDYDNLIHFCVMVKNGGEQFESMLNHNKSIIDRWTILDTGSTDNTVEVIQNTLGSSKQGTLYQEPFVNFKVSRNRCLDLAGTKCKFIIMLDDTYYMSGDLRKFLNIIRGDQFSTSFTVFIKSDDVKYGSNRIIKSDSGLRYRFRIHEVITDYNNINVVIPEEDACIIDKNFDYMQQRTQKRKELDLKLLYEEIEEDKSNPRTYYYLAQTYSQLQQYDKAYQYYLERANFTNSGFIQERIDALFEAARIANFQLNRPWEEYMALYEKAWKADESRPDSIYFMGINHYLKGEMTKAYEFFKKGFAIGFPVHCQFSLKPTISYHFLPKFLSRLCYQFNNWSLGLSAAELFLQNNPPTADDYQEIASYYRIFQKMNEYKGIKQIKPSPYSKPLFVFVADGGFHPWSGSNILTTGVGGSETYIIEMARYIQKQGTFQVIVFCNCTEPETFEDVEYKQLSLFSTFVNETYIEHCMISRFTEYLPLAFNGYTENVYVVLHDLGPSINMIPLHQKLKQIFCLTEWHVSHFLQSFPTCASITVPFYYGIDFSKFKNTTSIKKVPYKFIYSSFPNRGLLPLLQMWPHIYKLNPSASLHIYSDVNGKWVNDVAPAQMAEIRNLLEQYTSLNISYHGWVDKATLAEAWLSSDVWLYPCTFMETFCLTALEAALTNTLVITNDLAALQNTVGNRGIIIPGDASTTEWQQNALAQIALYFSTQQYSDRYDNLRLENQKWASTLSWENRAHALLQEYILPQKFIYKGMYGWYHDLPINSKEIFINILKDFNTNYATKKESVNILEIGTWTGMSLIRMLEQIPNGIGYGVDRWTNYTESTFENTWDNLQNLEIMEVENSFKKNAISAGFNERMFPIKGHSHDVLLQLISENKRFDFIYVDGSHSSIDTYTDCYLAWQLLEKGGIMGIDDYEYNLRDNNVPLLNIQDNKNLIEAAPYFGINQFLNKYNDEYRLIHKSYRVFIEKL